MTAKKPSVGAALEAWCTKCKDDKPHVVETLKKDGNVWRVRCEVCDGSHLFRLPKGAEGAGRAAGGSKKASGSKGKSRSQAVSEAEAQSAKEYVVGGDFSAGDVIRHARFGLGKVAEVRPGGKMVVGFEDGQRLLLCRDIPTVGKRRSAPPRVVVALVAPEEPVEVATEEADTPETLDVAGADEDAADDAIEGDDEEE
jgi:hypothetical protein